MPTSSLLKKIYSEYKKRIIPFIGDKIAKDKNAYKYLEESISQFPHQDIFLNEINNIGFKNANYINLFNGIVSIHRGFKV